MFHQFIFAILLCAVFVVTVYSDVRLYYHLLYKRDYLQWSAQSKSDYQDLRTLMGERHFKFIMAGIFGLTVFCVILVYFALFWLSNAFDSPMLTHVAATSLLLAILGNFISICTFPIPGVTTIKIEKPKIMLDMVVSAANYCCLVDMLIQIIIIFLK